MNELLIIIFISALLFAMGVIIKYLKAYNLISGYNTLPKEVKEQVDVKSLGDFFGRQMMLMSITPILGWMIKNAGFLWGIEIGFGLLLVIAVYTAIKSGKYIPAHKKNKSSKIGVLFTIGVVTVVAAVVIWNAMPAQFILENDQLVIEGAYGINIAYEEIEVLELEEDIPSLAARTNGAQLGPIARGHFRLEDNSRALLFLRSKNGPVIIIDRQNHQPAVMINFKDPEDTISLYEKLKEKVR